MVKPEFARWRSEKKRKAAGKSPIERTKARKKAAFKGFEKI